MGNLSREEKIDFLFSGDLGEAAKKLSQDQLDDLKEERDDVILTFSTPHGQRIFLDLIDSTYLFIPFVTQSAASYAKEGKREIGLYYLHLLGTKAFMNLYNKASEQLLITKKKG
jgi:hypothetical protein